MFSRNKALRLFCILSIFGTLASITACNPGSEDNQSDRLKGTIAISGAWALYPIMTRWAEEFELLHPEVQFDISAGGAGKGMADVLANVVDIGMVSRDIRPEEEEKGAFWIPVTKDAVFAVMNEQNPVLDEILQQGIQRETFIDIFITGEIDNWGQAVNQPAVQDEIHVYTRSDAAGAPETWANYLGMRQENLLGIGIFGDPGLLEAVAKDPLGIGFNNLGYAYDNELGVAVAGVRTIPIDANENGLADQNEILETKLEAVQAVADGIYPAPPARDLNLVTHGKPQGIVKEFLAWILTDGQALVSEAGYVQLSPEHLNGSLEKLQ